MPDHIYLKSFKLYDPKVVASNQHFVEARKQKAEFEKLHKKLGDHAKDLMSNMSESEAHQDHRNLTELYHNIPHQHVNLIHHLYSFMEYQEGNIEYFFETMHHLPHRSFYNESMH